MSTVRDVDWYIDRAKTCSGIVSNRKLGLELGISEGAMSHFKTGRAFPSDETMVKLAKLAQVDPDLALLDLGSWKTTGEAKEAYERLKSRFVSLCIIAALTLTFVIFPPDDGEAQASGLSTIQHSVVNPDLYIITLQDWQNRPSPGNGPGRRHAHALTPDLAPFWRLAVWVLYRPDAFAPWR